MTPESPSPFAIFNGTQPLRRVVGCMTGTSLDGLDTALVEIRGQGLEMQARFVRGVSLPLASLRDNLLSLSQGNPMAAMEVASLSRMFATLHGEAVQQLLGDEQADFIAVHGQTILHQPPLSWQLFNPAVLAAMTGLPVVSDLRAGDLAVGGEGAPITPIADFVFFRSDTARRVVVNLGGFINITIIPPKPRSRKNPLDGMNLWLDTVTGRDVCVCNQLLNSVARKTRGNLYDVDGKMALAGTVADTAFAQLVELLGAQSQSGRSLGVAGAPMKWVETWKGQIADADLARTACAAIAQTLAEAVGGSAKTEVLLAGGGVRNAALKLEIEKRSKGKVALTDDYGLPIEYREAAAMAVIGALSADGVPATLRQVTHAERAALAGSWTIPYKGLRG